MSSFLTEFNFLFGSVQLWNGSTEYIFHFYGELRVCFNRKGQNLELRILPSTVSYLLRFSLEL